MKLTIPLQNGETWETEAVAVIGDLAIHPSRKESKKWSVTHIPTLKSLNEVAPRDATKTALIKWAGKVQSGAIMVDWLELQQNPHNADSAVTLRIRKHCLEIK